MSAGDRFRFLLYQPAKVTTACEYVIQKGRFTLLLSKPYGNQKANRDCPLSLKRHILTTSAY
ncbi:hypothetical protein Brsp01_17610 [Brucella sp. NBRC 12950]|nr:hypothetical protein Brsp01_17610 [Brucella sp. NBRC 12950]